MSSPTASTSDITPPLACSTPKKSAPPHLIPNAPRKRTEKEAKHERDMRLLRMELDLMGLDNEAAQILNRGQIRGKYLSYFPCDIMHMKDINFLELLRDMYFPSSQPRTPAEEGYLEVMRDALALRIKMLCYENEL